MTQLLPPTPTTTSTEVRWGRAQHLLGRTVLGPVLVAGAAVAMLGLLQVVDPTEPGHLPTCPFLALTGWFCPGCGSLRMLHHLGEADLVGAAAMNPLGLLMVLALLAYWLAWTRRVLTGRPRGAPLHGSVVWLFLVVVVVYAVLRNLPGLGLLAPG